MQNSVRIHRYHPERGSLLVAMLAVLILFGATYMATQSLQDGDLIAPDEARIQSKAEMEVIADHIAAYVHDNNRLPCPALPSTQRTAANYGLEATGGGNSCLAVGAGGGHEGILPFRTLGLPDRYATDGWKRFYTYGVSPVFAETDKAPDTGILINCRETNNWVINFGGLDRNINTSKARFCCPDSTIPIDIDESTDIRMFRGAVQLDSNGPSAPLGRVAGSAPGDANDGEPAANVTLANVSAEAFAYTLISHGNNGYGAYLVDNTNNRKDVGVFAPPPADEAENVDGDRDYQTKLANYSDVGYGAVATAPYFDDLVLHRTQHGIFNELNGASCRTSY